LDSGISKVIHWFYKEKFTFLLFSLFVYGISAPFFEHFFRRGLFAEISFSVVLITAVLVAATEKKKFITIVIIVLLCLALVWYKRFYSRDTLLLTGIGIRMLFVGAMFFIIAGDFYKSNQVSRDTICAALIGYLLLALLWSNFYFLIEIFYPNSFSLSHEALLSDPSIFRYFSLVTITTLGFGDISPVASQARNLTVLEAFIGQMYLAVLIARLVAIHTTMKRGNS
jgi:hypothetical protein